ncbi:MAG: M15 family metallopeptidase [Prevotella sp.]|jgi:D-alanyl-D-alanine dipeptidase|nr:M15 family metallopeptidase [Prevotella sp.]MBF1585351.1 M15 family metallopeptidase [Prevotella sp.]
MLKFYRFHRQKWNKALASLIFFSFNCSLFAVQLSQSSTTKRSATAQQLARQGYQEIGQCDPTIHVSLMYARPDNFCGVVLYHDLREAFLHPEAMRGLQKAQAYLKQLRPDLSLKVYDAARPMHIQQRMWDEVKHTSKAIYVSNPAHGGGMHNYGMAVDITLCTLKGDTLDMGTKIDYMGKAAHIDNEAALVSTHIISPEARRNRQLLRQVMRYGGFMPLRTEWWHFNKCSRAVAKKYYKVIP